MLTIYRSEASASLRRVPIWLMGSNGTAPATGESAGQPQINWLARGTATANTAATLSLVSANAGLYYVELSASEVSALGVISIQYASATAIAQSVFAKVVNYDSGDSMRLAQFALPNAAANASGGLPLKGTTHSDFTSRLDLVQYSGATVGVNNIAPNVYSGVSVGIKDSGIVTTTFVAGSYSGVSVEVKSGGIQTTSIGKGAYSGVSVEVTTGGIQVASIGKGAYSGVTTEINNIAPASYSQVTIQGILDPSAIWNASRSSYTALGSFGIASQVGSASTLQGGTVSTLTLNSTESSMDSVHNGDFIMLQYPSGQWMGNIISSYSGSNKSALLQTNLPVAAVSGMTYVIFPGTPGTDLSTLTIGGVNNIKPATFSGVTLGINNIAAGAYSGVTIDGAKFLSAAGERSAASSLLSSNMGGTTPRLFQQGWDLLRNKVVISGSTMTVFKTDDATSSWTATISTGTATVYGVAPGLA